MLNFQIYRSRSSSGLCLDPMSHLYIKRISHISTNLARTSSVLAVAAFLMILWNSKSLLSPMILYVIYAFLNMSIFLSISHAASIFLTRITFLSTSLGSLKTNVFFYVVHVMLSSPRIISPSKHLLIFDGLDLFQKSSKI